MVFYKKKCIWNRIENGEPVRKMKKEIYGLKQAPKVWFDKLKATLVRLGYKPTRSDNSLFTKFYRGTLTYVPIYVDDFIITGSNDNGIRNII